MTKTKKLIEVAMPIKEISAESVRDKSIRHGHISTLHLWWARRPLPVCRAVVFASLVPDPLDEHCPKAFKEAVEILLGEKANTKRGGKDGVKNVYKPYDDIPHTAVVDKMEDNLRNRLMMFIGKFSDKYVENEKQGKKTPAKELLSDFSLIKWDNKNDEDIINVARKLIFVSHNAKENSSAKKMMADFDERYNNIKTAEKSLYEIPDRHISTPEVIQKEDALQNAIAAFLAKMPKVFDPFAGGGAIPLEAARLGCNSYGNDINPVAHIIQKGSCEFPQKYGKPITYSKEEFLKIYGEEEFEKQKKEGNVFGEQVDIPNRLAHDVAFYAKKLLKDVEEEVGHLYPADENGNKPIAYYWARTAICSNPSCKAEIPLLKQFYLCKKTNKNIYLNPIIKGTKIDFSIETGKTELEGWVRNRKNLFCPCCENITPNKFLKEQFNLGNYGVRLLAIIEDSPRGKNYRQPRQNEIDIQVDTSGSSLILTEKLPKGNTKQFDLCPWGFETFQSMFTHRQQSTLQAFVSKHNEYQSSINGDEEYIKAILTYLAIWIDRVAIVNTAFGRWHISGEKLEHPFSRQAIAMTFDYPESNPFCGLTGSAKNQIFWIIRYINSEEFRFQSWFRNSSSGEKNQFKQDEITCVITDPPYYDAIAYADLSDFFYVWMKRTLGKLFPMNFAIPQTPKVEECTALKHYHKGSKEKAFEHFDNKLLKIFDAIEFQTKELVSIMFAHQSTKAWVTLCNSILGARMNITGSWSMDTELANRTIGLAGDALTSSVTVSCRPSKKSGFGDYKEVQKEILEVIKYEIKELYALGFRGADLLTACFGKAVSVFGKYESVEKSDGSEVTVAELLEMAKEAAFKAIISDIETDDSTKFYIGWLNLFGFSQAVHDDVRRITQIGLNLNIDEIYKQHILVKEKDKGRLGTMEDRIAADARMGLRPVNNTTLDIAHRMMFLWKQANRAVLLDYIANKAPNQENQAWRVLNSLRELLPASQDLDYATGLLNNQENLLREAKNRGTATSSQITLDL